MKIGIIGCGNMGLALLKGIVAKGNIDQANLLVSDKDRKKVGFAHSRLKVKAADSNKRLISSSDVVILAVKPQDLDSVLRDATSVLDLKSKLFISICAGISTQRVEGCLGEVPVVRVMPNLPALVLEGISALCLGRYATVKDKKIAIGLFSYVGEVVEIKEQLMDVLTAISGSGPAYFFYLVEKLIDTAEELGISNRIAQRLAIKTALGSAVLMDQSNLSPKTLRKSVSSKGGTTEAAFNVFKNKGLDRILTQAFKAAARKSKKLGKGGFESKR